MSIADASKTQEEQKTASTAVQFRADTTKVALSLLKNWVGEERAAEATGRIAVALAASAAASKNPAEFYACTKESVAKVIAISALTGIMPSTGPTALAYAIPRRPRKGAQPQLQYQLSHRGINALANRAGMHMVATPISRDDELTVDEAGDVIVKARDLDNPPTNEEQLRGVIITVRRLDTGKVLCNGWVAKKLIDTRRDTSDSYLFAEKPDNAYAKTSSPWHVWYVEQAMKTAMHYAIGRGWCIVDDTEAVRALTSDQEADFTASKTITVEPTAGSRTQRLEAKFDELMPQTTHPDFEMANDPQEQ